MALIGIDLGTTNSLAAAVKDGKVQLIPNAFGEYLTPSVVSFDEDGEVFVGKIAKEMLITRPGETFLEFKRNMGTDYLYRAGEREYRAEELSAFLLRRLKEDAEQFLHEPVTEAIISVPAYFDDDKRCATKTAGKLAGITVERLINEPSAVALYHHLNENIMETFIVFDFGGGTLDVSLVDAFDNVVEIRAVAGDNRLGGKDFNEVIAAEFYRRYGVVPEDFSPEEQGIVRKEAEQLKIALSTEKEAVRTFLLSGNEYTMRLTNQELIHCAVDLFKRISAPIQKVMNDADILPEEIDKIILAGGSSKMPVVRQYIESLMDVTVVMDENPDESIALGVGTAAGIKERTGDLRDMILSDICPFSLGIELFDGSFSPIIERNDTLPCSRTRHYATVHDNQTKLDVHIYQGENLMARDNLHLCEMQLCGLPKAKAGEVGASVTFLYDINGILDIRIEGGGQTQHKVVLNKNAGLTDAQVEERVKLLQKQSLHPFGRERDRLLIERAQRVYMESDKGTREMIARMLYSFKDALERRVSAEVRENYVRLSLCLEAVENRKFRFEEFDESFFDSGDEPNGDGE